MELNSNSFIFQIQDLGYVGSVIGGDQTVSFNGPVDLNLSIVDLNSEIGYQDIELNLFEFSWSC
jgi:hypothetical protein